MFRKKENGTDMDQGKLSDGYEDYEDICGKVLKWEDMELEPDSGNRDEDAGKLVSMVAIASGRRGDEFVKTVLPRIWKLCYMRKLDEAGEVLDAFDAWLREHDDPELRTAVAAARAEWQREKGSWKEVDAVLRSIPAEDYEFSSSAVRMAFLTAVARRHEAAMDWGKRDAAMDKRMSMGLSSYEELADQETCLASAALDFGWCSRDVRYSLLGFALEYAAHGFDSIECQDALADVFFMLLYGKDGASAPESDAAVMALEQLERETEEGSRLSMRLKRLCGLAVDMAGKKPDKAIRYMKEFVREKERLLGKDHPALVDAKTELLDVLRHGSYPHEDEADALEGEIREMKERLGLEGSLKDGTPGIIAQLDGN